MGENKVALVTGASRGLGRALALDLAERGYEVVATMRDPSAGEGLIADAHALKGDLRVERLDVADPGGFALPNGLSVLINNAGVRLKYLPVEELSMAEWRETFETNLFGVVDMTRRAVPIMRASGGGVICNITSIAMFSPWPFYAAYRASKAAVAAMNDSLAFEVSQFNIRVLEVPLGPVDTDLLATSIMRQPAEAIEYEHYRDLAERQDRLRDNLQGSVTKPAEAAKRIVDAIEDDTSGVLRMACDDGAVGALDRWRTWDDESYRQDVRQSMGLDADGA